MWLKKNFNLLVIVGACILILTFLNKKEDYIKEYNDKIDALGKKVDSLHSTNDELTFKIDTLNQQISKLDQQLDQKDTQIQDLKYEVKNQVNAVDTYTHSELEEFFTNRYRHYLDSIAKINR